MAKRCIYVLRNNRICGRLGSGDPPLCDTHLAQVMEDEGAEEDVMESIFRQPAVQGLFDRLGTIVEQLGGVLERRLGGVGVGGAPAGTTRPRQPIPINPRVILGFPPEMKLTEKIIKERQRALAKLWHPDIGGSPEAMTRLNAATDMLLKKCRDSA